MATEPNVRVVKFSGLSLLDDLNESIYFPVVFNGVNYSMTFATLKGLINKTTLNLQNVDNTRDKDKPLSDVAVEALAGKADRTQMFPIEQIQGLPEVLNNFAARVHSHAIDDVTELGNALNGKAPVNHGHAMADVTGLTQALAGKAATDHDHQLQDVGGLTQALENMAQELNTAPVDASRIQGLAPVIRQEIESNPEYRPTVVGGDHTW